MKRSEALTRYYNKLTTSMVDHYRTVLECGGRIQYGIYVWEDGEIEILEDVQGGNSWLQARDYEPRELFYVCTIESPCFDPWDYADDSAPEDESARESEEANIIDWLVDEYESNASEILDIIITEAERDEKYDDD